MVCKNLINKEGKTISRVSVSKILLEGSNGKEIKSYMNRDINACKNIRKIVKYGLENKLKRPKWYKILCSILNPQGCNIKLRLIYIIKTNRKHIVLYLQSN